jgi:hypothetical protein
MLEQSGYSSLQADTIEAVLTNYYQSKRLKPLRDFEVEMGKEYWVRAYFHSVIGTPKLEIVSADVATPEIVGLAEQSVVENTK